MDTKGNSAELIHHLAEDLKEWAELRKAFKGQIRSARKFVSDYCHCCYQDDNEKDMKAPIDKFEAEIGERIDELDQTVKDLLQFVCSMLTPRFPKLLISDRSLLGYQSMKHIDLRALPPA